MANLGGRLSENPNLGFSDSLPYIAPSTGRILSTETAIQSSENQNVV